MKPKEVIQRIKSQGTERQDLIDAAGHENQSVRGSAFQLLAERYSGDSDVVELLRQAALDPLNAVPVMGANTLAHLCVKLLSAMKEPTAQGVAISLIEHWPVSDKNDLEWFLKNG